MAHLVGIRHVLRLSRASGHASPISRQQMKHRDEALCATKPVAGTPGGR
jgi:hypothetical protein